MWNRWRGKLAGEGLLRRANQTVTDRAAGRTDHREASGGVAAAFHDVCSGVPIGRREDLAMSFLCSNRTNFGGVRWPSPCGREQGAACLCGLRGLELVPHRWALPLPTSKIRVFALGPAAWEADVFSCFIIAAC